MTVRRAASNVLPSVAYVPTLSRAKVRLRCKSADCVRIFATGVQNNAPHTAWITVSAAPSRAGGV